MILSGIEVLLLHRLHFLRIQLLNAIAQIRVEILLVDCFNDHVAWHEIRSIFIVDCHLVVKSLGSTHTIHLHQIITR